MPVAFPDPPLAAAGLALRLPDADDVPWITAACGDRELSRYIPGIPYPYSQSDARAFIEHAGQGWAEGTSAAFVIADAATGDGRGTIGLHLYPTDAELAEDSDLGIRVAAGSRTQAHQQARPRLSIGLGRRC